MAEQLAVVTPEAVVLDFQTANVGSRALARAIDLMLQGLVLLALSSLVSLGAAITGSQAAVVVGAIASLVAVVAVIFGYPILFESLWNGQTPGKAILGLRVLTREGGPVRFRHTLLRSLIGFVEVLAMTFIAILATVLSRTNQRVGDMAAGTIVVRERAAGGESVAVSYPPPVGLDDYVRTLDVAPVDTRQYGVVRSFLTRVDRLRPAVRASMAVRLANPVALSMRHDPPPGITPELFLVCVASAYQLRHGGPGLVWSAPGWSGYGLPRGWGFPPGYNGLTPAPAAGWGAAPSGWGAPPSGPTPPGWGGPSPGPIPPGGGWAGPPGAVPPGEGWGAPPAGPGSPAGGWSGSPAGSPPQDQGAPAGPPPGPPPSGWSR